ncbi:hypothetical protein [Burkholderia glumae]|uniref:hypothetical protein n=1 Tax=Burkholderia glumae TaxID=337 RepID=UPI00148EA4BE|nr:hypothetical protein [Burkholderia glumae]QJW78724.1 hypothetical protein GAS18_08120 [Burkholderia glumae]
MSIAKDQRIHLVNHSPNLYDRALRSHDGLTTAILAVASVEALTHDLATWLGWLDEHAKEFHPKSESDSATRLFGKQHVWCSSSVGHELTESEAKLLEVLDDLESDKKSVALKIQKILGLLDNKEGTATTRDLEDFDFLVEVRNEIVHPKGERLSQRLKGSKTSGNVAGHIALVRRLEAKNLIDRVQVHESWLNNLKKPFIEWCLLTTSNVVEDLLAALPDSSLMKTFRHQASIGRYGVCAAPKA